MKENMDGLTEGKIRFRLNEQEYKEFNQWYKKVFLKEKGKGKACPDQSNMKMDTELWLDTEGIHIHWGRTELNVLYSAVTELGRVGNLILFFAQKEFWAIPGHAIGDESEAAEWLERFKHRCQEGKTARIPMGEVEARCGRAGIYFCSYTRTVDQVVESYRCLGRRLGRMQNLRELSIFPYRYAGAQILALEPEGLYEYGEKSVVRHSYKDLKRAFYMRECLYLIKSSGEEILVPVEPLGGKEGVDRLLEACNGRRDRNQRPLQPKRIYRLTRTERQRMNRLFAAGAACIVLGISIWGLRTADRTGGYGGGAEAPAGAGAAAESGGAGQEAEAGGKDRRTGSLSGNGTGSAEGNLSDSGSSTAGSGLMITVPDDTVFDQAGEDGMFVSSSQFYRIQLPREKWSIDGGYDDMEYLESQWGRVLVRGTRNQNIPFMIMGQNIPRTKEDYIRRMTAGSGSMVLDLPEVLEYTYQEGKDGVIVRKEIRYREPASGEQGSGNDSGENGDFRYSLELNLTAPEYFYTVTVTPKTETPQTIDGARAILDSFRILDTSTGICRKIEENIFHGYYGKNLIMTNCLVLLEEDMSQKEIGECLETIKQLDSGFMGYMGYMGSNGGDALAARREGSSWLGIDCPSLQQNCTKENARKISKIFRSDVILYDEFDGDLLMVAYCDKKQKHAYQRATSFNPMILQSEFHCYGEEQEFPEDLLQYMDLTREEADAIWKDEEAVFQMDKWYELTSHMTLMPVPEEFIGMWDYKVLEDGFEVIRR